MALGRKNLVALGPKIMQYTHFSRTGIKVFAFPKVFGIFHDVTTSNWTDITSYKHNIMNT